MAGIENKIPNTNETQEQSSDILSLLDKSIQDNDFKENIKKDIQTLPEKRQKRYLEIYQKIETHILSQGKSGKDLFINYLFENPKNRDEIVNIIHKASKKGLQTKIEEYTQKNGYIINDDTKLAFKDFVSGKKVIEKQTEEYKEQTENKKLKDESTKKQTEEYKEQTEEYKEQREEYKEQTEKEKEKINKELKIFDDIFDSQLLQTLSPKVREIIVKIKNGERNFVEKNGKIEELVSKELIFLLRDSKPERTKLFTTLQKSSPEKFTSFTNYLKEQDPSFEGFVNQFKFDHTSLFSDGISKTLNISLYDDFEVDGDKYVADLGDGFSSEIDPTRFPPHRQITNGRYSLDSEIGVGDFYESTVNFEIEKKDFIKKIETPFKQKLKLLESEKEEILMILEERNAQIQNPDIPDNMIEELNQEILEKKQELQKTQIKIENLIADYKQELENFKKIEAIHKKNLEEDQLRFKQKLKEKDEKQKQTLKFLSQIGFDLIPQEITDQIIEKINLSTGLKSKYGFTNNIDLANGDLGINKDTDKNNTSFVEKKAFIEFVNLMISGDREIPNYMMANGDVVFYESKSDKESGKISFGNKQSYINKKLGSNPIIKINTNLEKISKN